MKTGKNQRRNAQRAQRTQWSRRSNRMFEVLEIRTLMSADPWQSPTNRFDVNGDGNVTPIDALAIVSALNKGITTLSTPTATMNPQTLGYLDVAGTGTLTPLDAVLEVNALETASLPTATSTALPVVTNDISPTLSINNVVVPEPGNGSTGSAVFTVTLSSASSSQVTVGYATQDNTATQNVDYTPESSTLIFPAGATTETITVPILHDSNFNSSSENFFLNLTSAANATISGSQGIGTISAVTPGLSISPTSVVENGTGSPAQSAIFTVTLSAATTQAVTVNYNTQDDSAVAGTDYTQTSSTLTIPAGQTTGTISVPILQNPSFTTGTKDFIVDLSDPSNAEITDGSAKATLFPAGSTGAGNLVQISLKYTDTSGNPVTVLTPGENFLLEADVQDLESDPQGVFSAYTNLAYNSALVKVTGNIEYPGQYIDDAVTSPGSTPGTIVGAGATAGSLTPLGGGSFELFAVPMQVISVGELTTTASPTTLGNEPVSVYGNNSAIPTDQVEYGSATIATGTNGIAITGPSSPVINTPTGATATFTVTRSSPDDTTITIPYSTVDGTAVAGADYVKTTSSVTFVAGGPDTQTIAVPIIGNSIYEPSKTFSVMLGAPTVGTATISTGTATATIQSQVAEPTVSIVTSPQASTSEGSPLVFTISLSAPSGVATTVNYATANGTAIAGTNYTSETGTATIPAGQTSTTVSIPTIYSAAQVTSKTMMFTINSPTNATLGTASATGVIQFVKASSISGYVYVDTNNDGIKETGETGIEGVTLTLTNASTGATQTVTTDSTGLYTFVGLQPGSYNVTEIQPGFYIAGKATAGSPAPAGPTTGHSFSGITITSGNSATNYDFGEQGLRSQFVSAFLNRRAFLATSIVTHEYGPTEVVQNFNLTKGDVWISFDDGWQGLRTIEAEYTPSAGSVTLTLFNNNLTQIAVSNASQAQATLSYSGTLGQTYFLEISGTNPKVNLLITDAGSSTAIPVTTSQFAAASGSSASGSTSSAASAYAAHGRRRVGRRPVIADDLHDRQKPGPRRDQRLAARDAPHLRSALDSLRQSIS